MKWLGWIMGAGLVAMSTSAFAWDQEVVTDEFTGDARGIASVMDKEQRGLLVVKCDTPGKGSLYVSIISTNYLGSGYRGYRRDLEYRFDGGEAGKLLVHYTDRSALITETGPRNDGGRFVARLAESSSLVVRATSYRGDLYTLSFDTQGAREAINGVATACRDTNWTT